jgi:hypothetical protein
MDSSRQGIGPSRRTLQGNTQHSQETDIHVTAGSEPAIPSSKRWRRPHILDSAPTVIGDHQSAYPKIIPSPASRKRARIWHAVARTLRGTSCRVARELRPADRNNEVDFQFTLNNRTAMQANRTTRSTSDTQWGDTLHMSLLHFYTFNIATSQAMLCSPFDLNI